MYCKVYIDNPSSNVDMEYTYIVPINQKVEVGVRVKVPFGQGNRPTLGIVVEVIENANYDDLKEIVEVLDDEPIISPLQLELAKYIKNETISPMSRILNLMIPEFARLKTIKYLELLDSTDVPANILELFDGEKTIKYTNNLEEYKSIINKLVKSENLLIKYEAVEKKTNKWIKKYQLNSENYEELYFSQRSEARREIINLLKDYKEGLVFEEIEAYTKASNYLVNKMTKEGILKETFSVKSRIKNLNINYESKETYKEISYFNRYLDNTYTLLMGTDKEEEFSFLTEIIKTNIQNNQKTLILVADILKSYEISSLLRKHLKLQVACLNSNLTNTQEYDYFNQLDEFDIYVSTPAYALWPYKNLGTIFMFDEESSNYRNDQSPRYDLTLVLKEYVKLLNEANINTKLVYHSVCPKLQTYTHAMLNHITLLNKPTDINNEIEIVDMMESIRSGNSIISPKLYMQIARCLENKEQVLLILNNKGYSTSVLCRNCGTTLKCNTCNVPYQYHKTKNELYCPTCYKKFKATNTCPVCKSTKLSYDGLGMEKLKELVLELFPDSNPFVLKESSFDELEEAIDTMNEDKSQILITSDTFQRSINLPKLKLIGIINLDVEFNKPTYDANHIAYTMLSHSNRLMKNGKMIIQTYKPKHNVLKYFILNNYDEYYYEELKIRNTLKVEPLYEVNRILIKGDFQEVFKIAQAIKQTILNLNKDITVIGPSYNYQEKKVQLVVKHKDKNIKNIYMHIYQMFQKTTTQIIFDRYSKMFI